MSYELTDVDDGTRVTFIQEDPRASDDAGDDADDDNNPVLIALRDVAEAITNQ